MKALIINSSARIQGNSAKALQYAKEILEEYKIESTSICLSKIAIGICAGCRLCFDKGEENCPHKDDVLSLNHKLANVDLIVFGGPIYVEDINGIAKNWIDRMAFNCHRPGLYNQKAYILLNSGSGASQHAIKTLERAFLTWGIQVSGKRKLVLGAKIGENDFRIRYASIIRKDIDRIVKGLDRGPNIIQLLTYYIQKWYYENKMEKGSYDYEYWLQKGWLEKKRKYYEDIKVGILKTALVRLMGLLLIKIVLR